MNIKSLGKEVKVREYTCSKCQSVIEYTENEMKEKGNWVRTGVEESTYHGYKYVICPACKSTHEIETVERYY